MEFLFCQISLLFYEGKGLKKRKMESQKVAVFVSDYVELFGHMDLCVCVLLVCLLPCLSHTVATYY